MLTIDYKQIIPNREKNVKQKKKKKKRAGYMIGWGQEQNDPCTDRSKHQQDQTLTVIKSDTAWEGGAGVEMGCESVCSLNALSEICQ